MAAFFNALFQLLSPVIIFFISVASIVAFLLGALADPQGLMNQVVCSVIDGIASILPSTPENLKIATIINNLGDTMPLAGRGVIREVFSTVATIAGLLTAIKVYKLLPFKFS